MLVALEHSRSMDIPERNPLVEKTVELLAASILPFFIHHQHSLLIRALLLLQQSCHLA